MHIFIQTPRLILRQWQDSDTAPFIQMCADDKVMRYFLKKLNTTEATAFLERIKSDIKKRGWGLFVVELKSTGEFIGFIGLNVYPPELAFADAPEISWRLLPQYWNQGYATEGAKAVLKYAFRTLRLEKVISFTARINTPSERVMQNIGLEKVGEFDHPLVSADHILCRHVLYEKQRSDYLHIPFC
ncbi:GNAT family N-acetyltransferase [Acinetobacter sp. ASP199]|uniref:GNAT family N-acetyltransferase n=1 Tax=unclassified Acinetobacter TaxID=196816 RepID=UPI001F60E26F|nr:GNAT family N-acetyltransferase [Acinetobacter sp. ASP199]UNT60319.1 GNAT family N-acetyltransferase [Acinetobacter sp. ASP199]